MRPHQIRLLSLVMVAAALAAPAAQAVTIVIDDDDPAISDNQDISTLFPGVTLAAVPPGPVYAVRDTFAITPPRVFGSSPGDTSWSFLGRPDFSASFNFLANQVSIDWASDFGGTLYAYDAHGVLLGSDMESGGNGTFTFTAPGNLIKSILVVLTKGVTDAGILDHLVISVADQFELIGYATNLGSGDSTFNLTNPGTIGGSDPGGDICANVYVFDPSQELIACCSCPLTPNHLKTLSVGADLIRNTLTPGIPSGVTVAFIPSTACDASAVNSTNIAPGLAGWGITLHAVPGGGFGVTETKLQPALLSPSELKRMTSQCGFIEANGSKFGICGSCREGAQGARKK
jgi:hypothetical protein